MLVLETLVPSKLKSACLIGTSDIEQYSLCFRSRKNINYFKCLDYLGLLDRGSSAMDFVYSGSHISGKP